MRCWMKNRSLFPSDEAVFKLIYLGLRNISKRDNADKEQLQSHSILHIMFHKCNIVKLAIQ